MSYHELKETLYPSGHNGRFYVEVDPDENNWYPAGVFTDDGVRKILWRREIRLACPHCRKGDYDFSVDLVPEHREKPTLSEDICPGSGQPPRATNPW